MKSIFKTALLFLMLFVTLGVFAQDTETALDFKDPASVLIWLSPVITLGITWVVKKLMPFVTGVVTLIVVPLISAGIAYLATVLTDGDASWIVLFLAGLGSTFLHQFKAQIT